MYNNKNYRKYFLIFCGVCLIMILYDFLLPFRFKMDIDYSTRYFARDNDRIIEISPLEKANGILRIEIDSIGELKPEFIKCLLAAEDNTFFRKIVYFRDDEVRIKNLRFGPIRGVPVMGTLRAMFSFGRQGGGSGLIQQLAKNMVTIRWEKYTGSQKQVQRKYVEMLAAFALTSVYSREELFMMYLNTIPVLNISDGRVFGFKAAAFRFFGTSNLSDLSLDQFATMVASLRGGHMKDIENSESLKKHRDLIFDRMVRFHYLDEETALKYRNKPIVVNNRYSSYYCFRTAIQYIRKQARMIAKEYDLDTNLTNYRIYTTLSRWVQTAASKAVEQTFQEISDFRYLASDTLQTGLAVIAPSSGELLALVGDAEPFHFSGRLNHAYQINRQIGSTVKPFVYAAFFQKGGTPNSLLLDDSIPGKFNPSNFNGKYSKKMLPAGRCLSGSLNMPTANIVNKGFASVSEIRALLKRCGFGGRLPKTADIVLGSFESSPVEMARIYCTFAGGGHYVPSICITRIENRDGEEVWNKNLLARKRRSPGAKYVIEPAAINAVNQCLVEALEPGGTGANVRTYYKGPAAGKTGTTSRNRDAWFIGYNKNLCGAVWIGYDKNSTLPEKINTGGKIAAPLWGKMMKNLESSGILSYSKSDE